jgi:hypothetical protein
VLTRLFRARKSLRERLDGTREKEAMR